MTARGSLALIAVVALLGGVARAQAPEAGAGLAAEGPSAADRIRAAQAAERAHEPAEAARLYREAEALDPTSRLASRARRRLEWLEARREGDWAPLAALMRFRDTVPAERTRADVEAFEAAAQGFPAGRVRREAWPLIADAWLGMGEPARAEAAYRALLREPALGESERVTAMTGIARAMGETEGAAAAAAHLREAGLEATPTHSVFAREATRRVGRVVAWAALALFALGAVALGRRRLLEGEVWRRALSPGRLLVAAYATVGPLLLAIRYDAEALDTFGYLGAGTALVLAVASLGGAALSTSGRASRPLLAALAVAAHLAVGYLALDRAGQLLSFA